MAEYNPSFHNVLDGVKDGRKNKEAVGFECDMSGVLFDVPVIQFIPRKVLETLHLEINIHVGRDSRIRSTSLHRHETGDIYSTSS
jgi:hypothetical protein